MCREATCINPATRFWLKGREMGCDVHGVEGKWYPISGIGLITSAEDEELYLTRVSTVAHLNESLSSLSASLAAALSSALSALSTAHTHSLALLTKAYEAEIRRTQQHFHILQQAVNAYRAQLEGALLCKNWDMPAGLRTLAENKWEEIGKVYVWDVSVELVELVGNSVYRSPLSLESALEGQAVNLVLDVDNMQYVDLQKAYSRCLSQPVSHNVPISKLKSRIEKLKTTRESCLKELLSADCESCQSLTSLYFSSLLQSGLWDVESSEKVLRQALPWSQSFDIAAIAASLGFTETPVAITWLQQARAVLTPHYSSTSLCRDVQVQLSRALAGAGNLEAAMQCVAQITESQTLVQHGRLLMLTGQRKAAKTAFKAAIGVSATQSREWGVAMSALAKADFQRGSTKKALQKLLKLDELAKELWLDGRVVANCMHNIALLDLERGQINERLQQSLELRRDMRDTGLVLGYHLLGVQQTLQGLREEALSSLQQARELATDLLPSYMPYLCADILTLETCDVPYYLGIRHHFFIVEELVPDKLRGLGEVLGKQAGRWELQDWQEAERRYVRARELGAYEACPRLAALYAKHGKRAEAAALWRDQMERVSREQICSFALADAKLALAQLIGPASEAITLSLSAAELYKQLGQVQKRQESSLLVAEMLTDYHRLSEAEALLGELGEVSDDWGGGLQQLGKVYEGLQRLEQAEECYWKAENVEKRYGRDTEDLWLRIALVKEQQYCLPEAISLLSTSPQPLFQPALGRIYWRIGESAQAEAILLAAIQKFESAEACYELGQLYAEAGKREQACSYFQRALQATENRSLLISALFLLASLQDCDEGAESWKRIIALGSNYPLGDFRVTQSWLALADLESRAGHIDTAKAHILSAIQYTGERLQSHIVEALVLATGCYRRLECQWQELAAHLYSLLLAEKFDTEGVLEVFTVLQAPAPRFLLTPSEYSRAPALLSLCNLYMEAQDYVVCLDILAQLENVPLTDLCRLQAVYICAVCFMWLEDWQQANSYLQQALIYAESTYNNHYKRKINILMSLVDVRNEPDLNQALVTLFSIRSQAANEELRLLVACTLFIGQSLHAHHQLEAAEECWRLGVEVAEQSQQRECEVEAREALAKLLLRLGLEEEAEKQVVRVLELTNGKSENCVEMGKIYVKQGRKTDARHMYERALTHVPDDLSVLSTLAALLLDLEDTSAARQVLQRAWDSLTSSPSLLTANTAKDCLLLAELFGQVQQPLQEQYIYSLLWHLDLPAEWQHQITQKLAEVCVRLGLNEEAISVYERDRERVGGNWPPALRQQLGLLYIQCGRLSDAQTILAPQSGSELFACGQAYNRAQSYTQAISCLESAVEQLSSHEKCAALLLLGDIYRKLSRWTDANRVLQAAFPLADELLAIDIEMSLSRMSSSQGSLVLATTQLGHALLTLESFTKSSEVKERQGKCHSCLAQIYERIDRPEDAKLNYIAAARIWEELGNFTAQLGDVYYNLGALYQKQGQFSQAEHYFLKELALQEPSAKQADTHHSLGLLYCASHRYDKAKQHYIEALDLCDGPAKAETLCGLGKVYRLLSKLKESRESFEAAVALYTAAGEERQAERVRKLLGGLSDVSRKE
jgi:tetratricopeptide (TPR) repeat protein